MQAGIGHGSIRKFQGLSRILLSRKTSMTWQGAKQRIPRPWICSSCYRQRSEYSASKTKAFTTRPVPKRQDDLHLSRPSSSNFSASSQNDASSNSPSSDNPPPTSPTPSNPPLPSHAENARSPTSKRLSHLMDNLQSSLFVASRRLNDLTGYTGIESLKSTISAQESRLSSTRARLQAARAAYTAAIQTRSASQREVNELLQRKHAWTALDLERFTALYRSDHANEQAEAKAQAELNRVEREAEETGERLSQSILTRYHEEQIWSDKIRRMSTWGTWGLMGVNVLLFLVFQIGVEPWRRRRLVKGFEEKVVEALERGEEKKGVTGGSGMMMSDGAGLKPTVEKEENVQVGREGDATPSTRVEMETDKEWEREVVAAPASRPNLIYRTSLAALKDLFSDRKITLRRIDVTLMMVEGAAAGMVVVGVIATLLRSR